MNEGLADLLPSRAYAKRMLELETELKRANSFQRRHSKSPETLGRWGLETPEEAQQEEGWFITYLDMMTLLLVVMIVMLAFSGTLNWQSDTPTSPVEVAAVATVAESPESDASTDHLPVTSSGPLAAFPQTPAERFPTPEPVSPGDSPFAHPADVGPLPRDAQVATSLPSALPPTALPVPSLAALYPGWADADLAASFIGPPRPPQVQETDTSTAVVVTPEPEPEQAPAPSEGEEVAAGLSLGELGNDVEVIINERSVSFRVNSEILFDTSQADLSRSGLAVLRQIVDVLSSSNHEVTVEGHTDSVPVRRNVRYPSNWELSSARAGSVVRYLQANGIERSRLKAVGYADTRPIADNHTPQGRASNRRVELLIEKRD